MLKKEKIEKPVIPGEETPENGENKDIMSMLRAILLKTGEHDEQIAELSAKDVTGQAKLLIASLAYDTPDNRMSELSLSLIHI